MLHIFKGVLVCAVCFVAFTFTSSKGWASSVQLFSDQAVLTAISPQSQRKNVRDEREKYTKYAQDYSYPQQQPTTPDEQIEQCRSDIGHLTGKLSAWSNCVAAEKQRLTSKCIKWVKAITGPECLERATARKKNWQEINATCFLDKSRYLKAQQQVCFGFCREQARSDNRLCRGYP